MNVAAPPVRRGDASRPSPWFAPLDPRSTGAGAGNAAGRDAHALGGAEPPEPPPLLVGLSDMGAGRRERREPVRNNTHDNHAASHADATTTRGYDAIKLEPSTSTGACCTMRCAARSVRHIRSDRVRLFSSTPACHTAPRTQSLGTLNSTPLARHKRNLGAKR